MEGSVVLAGETQSATQPVDVRIVEDISIRRLTKEELFPLYTPVAVWFLELHGPTTFRVETILEEVTTYTLGIVQVTLIRIEDGLLSFQCITAVIERSHEIRNIYIRKVQSEDINTGTF